MRGKDHRVLFYFNRSCCRVVSPRWDKESETFTTMLSVEKGLPNMADGFTNRHCFLSTRWHSGSRYSHWTWAVTLFFVPGRKSRSLLKICSPSLHFCYWRGMLLSRLELVLISSVVSLQWLAPHCNIWVRLSPERSALPLPWWLSQIWPYIISNQFQMIALRFIFYCPSFSI